MRKFRHSGFTLIELMITIAVLAILVTIAYPAYQGYAAQARRSDATINLTRIAALQEKFLTECGRYTSNFNGAISDPNPALRCTGLGIGATAASYTTLDGYYTFTIPILLPGPAPLNTPGGGGYTLSAAPAGAQANDGAKCTTLTLDNMGVKFATGTDGGPAGGKCWKK